MDQDKTILVYADASYKNNIATISYLGMTDGEYLFSEIETHIGIESSTQAENRAALAAILHAATYSKNIVIHTDCENVYKSLVRNKFKGIEGLNVTPVKVRGHIRDVTPLGVCDQLTRRIL